MSQDGAATSPAVRRGQALAAVSVALVAIPTLALTVALAPALGLGSLLQAAANLAIVGLLCWHTLRGRSWARWILGAITTCEAMLCGIGASLALDLPEVGSLQSTTLFRILILGGAILGAGALLLMAAPSISTFTRDRSSGYALFIAKRYMTSRSSGAVSMITVMAIAGVSLGVTIVITVLAVTTGFQQEFRDKVLGVNAHALVLKYGVDFEEYRDVMATAESLPGVEASAPFLFNTMMMESGAGMTEVLVKGIDPIRSPKVLDITDHIIAGSLKRLIPDPDAPKNAPKGVVLGAKLAERLRVGLGGQVRILSPLSSLEPGLWSAASSAPSSRSFEVVGLFDSGFMEYDARLAYVELGAAQSFYEHGDVVMGVELRVDDVWEAGEISLNLEESLGGYPYRAMDWRELNHNLFQALALQKLVLVIVFSLVMVVAAINIISTLHLMVISKRREISILKAMGASSGGVVRVFLTEGLFIGVIGSAIGVALGLGACWILQRFPFPLDARVYLIGELPIEVSASSVVLTALIVVVFAVLAALFPAYRASQLRPAEGLRWE